MSQREWGRKMEDVWEKRNKHTLRIDEEEEEGLEMQVQLGLITSVNKCKPCVAL